MMCRRKGSPSWKSEGDAAADDDDIGEDKSKPVRFLTLYRSRTIYTKNITNS
jgi:hypothetical protein